MLKNLVLNLEDRMTFDHHPNLPNSFRMLIIGSSGAGKTALLLQMLLEPGFIDFENMIIFTTTPNQQEFQLLYHGFRNGLSEESIASIMMNQNEFRGVSISILCKKYAEVLKHAGVITVRLTDKLNELTSPEQL